MSCCGKKRAVFKRQTDYTATDQGRHPPGQPATSNEESTGYFRYEGGSFLRIKGAITNKPYSFRFPGAIVAVDSRDLPSLMAEPELERVSENEHPKQK